MPATGQIYQVTYQMSAGGQAVENVLHFRELNGASTPAQIRSSAEGYLAHVAPLISNQCIFSNIIIKQMTPVAFDETVGPPVSTGSGTDSGALGNLQVALVLTKRTGTAGKTHRGRIYIGGISNAQMSVNIINASYATLAGTAVSNIMGQYGPSGTDTHLQLGLYSKTIGGSSPFTVAGWQPVTSIDVQPILGAQRRRRVGVGI